MTCKHPAPQLYSWIAYDGQLCVCCCICGAVLAGAAQDTPPPGAALRGQRDAGRRPRAVSVYSCQFEELEPLPRPVSP